MSHFSVLVVGPKDEEELAKAMAPFQENNMDDCPEEFTVFHDEEDENREQYETGTMKMVRCPNGELVYTWDERFRVQNTDGSGSFGIGSSTHAMPEGQGYEKVEVSYKKRFATFEEFMKEHHGHSERDKKKGRYGYWGKSQQEVGLVPGGWPLARHAPAQSGSDQRHGRRKVLGH